jgi:ribosomal protein L12E/L44/L45/RPP1/RPP2
MLANDDWRLQIDFIAESAADAVRDQLDAEELEHDLSEAFQDRVIVSNNGTTIFLYAGDKTQAERARGLVERLCEEDDEEVVIDFRRWHPIAEDWKPAAEPLPDDPAEERAERQEAIERELKETEERGYPEFEVRIDLPSRGEAKRFAEVLRADNLQVVRRWKYLLVGAIDEEHAEELVARIRDEAPPGSRVAAQGTWQEAYDKVFGPFARIEAAV